jgi:RNA polymerase sigma-70 factor (ECF subfamily)
VALLAGEAEESLALVADMALDQESLMVSREQSRQLRKCVARLPAEERLLLQFRFDQELSLEEIARLTGLGDAQRAHRHIGAILKKLRSAIK